MKAISITKPGGPEVLEIVNRPKPKIQAEEILIKVHAAGVNRPDIIQRKGFYPAPEGVSQDIPGLEVSGLIEDLGSSVKNFKIGDRVCALLAGGGYAEYASVTQLQCLIIPKLLSFEEAASLPETFFTVWTNVFDLGNIKKNDKFLVHGASSGIGVAAVQMVNSIGATVYGTAGNSEKCKKVEHLGARKCIDYKKEDFEQVIKELEPNGIDVVLDMIGGDYLAKNINLMNTGGRYLIINAMNGSKAELDLMRVMLKRIKITGSTLRSRDSNFKGEIAKKLKEHIWPKLATGEIKAVIHKIFPLQEASKAHELMENSNHIGKIVLKVI